MFKIDWAKILLLVNIWNILRNLTYICRYVAELGETEIAHADGSLIAK
jgi:hypothetical protein